MQENNTNENEIPELKSGEETEQEKSERNQRLADELADAMAEGVYPMDVVSFMWRTLEIALERNDVGFNHSGYTKAVIPYLLTLNPEYEETVICMTNSLRDLQKNRQAERAEPTVLDLSNHSTAEGECLDLTKHLSLVLNHPKLPSELEIVIANGISDLGNESETINKHYKSPEVLAELLNCEESEVRSA